MSCRRSIALALPIAVLGASWAETTVAGSPAGVDIRVIHWTNGTLDWSAYKAFGPLAVPATFVAPGVRFGATAYPLPAMSIEVISDNDVRNDLRASGVFGYFFEVSGPTTTYPMPVPVRFSGTYNAAVSDHGSGGAGVDVFYNIDMGAARGGFQCGRDVPAGCGDGMFGGTVSVTANAEHSVRLDLQLRARASGFGVSSAKGAIDPYLYIEPSWAAAHPDYSLSVFGVGNSPAAVPEPETYSMILAGLGLLGFAARRGKSFGV